MSCFSGGRIFPIREGVPRLYLSTMAEHLDFEKRCKFLLPQCEWLQDDLSDTKDVQKPKVSFSREWGQFSFGTEKTWGWDSEEKRSLFLKGMGLLRAPFKARVCLTLVAAMAYWAGSGGMDFSDSVVRTHQHDASNSVQLVQGDVMRPPLSGKEPLTATH